MNMGKSVLRRLHIVIPSEVFDAIYLHKDMESIDDIVTKLLASHYGVDLNAHVKK